MEYSTVRSTYSKIYDEMRERNKKNLLDNGVKPDTVLQSPEVNPRLSLALFAFFEHSPSTLFDQMKQEAHEVFPNQVIYNSSPTPTLDQARLHFTYFQIFKVDGIPEGLMGSTFTEYSSTLEKFFSTMPSFTLDYSGLIALPSGLAMYAYPSIDINEYREKLRETLMHEGLAYEEPYKVDIAHSTFIRLKEDEDPQKLLDFAAKYDGQDLGTLGVSALSLGLGSWRMWPEECDMIRVLQLRSNGL